MKPRAESAINGDETVAEWIDGDLCVWKENVVWEVVYPNDANAILKITIPLLGRSDVLRWPHTWDGRVIV